MITDHKHQDRNTVYEALIVIIELYENRAGKKWLVAEIAKDDGLQNEMQTIARDFVCISSFNCQMIAFDILHLHVRQLTRMNRSDQVEALFLQMPEALSHFIKQATEVKKKKEDIVEGRFICCALPVCTIRSRATISPHRTTIHMTFCDSPPRRTPLPRYSASRVQPSSRKLEGPLLSGGELGDGPAQPLVDAREEGENPAEAQHRQGILHGKLICLDSSPNPPPSSDLFFPPKMMLTPSFV